MALTVNQIFKGIKAAKADGISDVEVKKMVLQGLAGTGKGAPVEEPKQRGVIKQTGDLIESGGAQAMSAFAKGTGNLAKLTDVINPVSYLSKAYGQPTFGQETQKVLNKVAQAPLNVQQQLKDQQIRPAESMTSTGAKIGTVGGDVLGTVGAQVPTLLGGAKFLQTLRATPLATKLATQAPNISKAVNFGLASAGTTTVATGATEGRLPTAKEVGLYGLLDAAFLGLGTAGKSMYKSAFKGTKKQAVDTIKNYKTTIGDIAEKLGYKGSASSIVKQADLQANKVWGKLINIAKDTGSVSRKEFMEIVPTLSKQFDDLPNSQLKTLSIKELKNIVAKYAPKTSASGEEIVGIVKNINKGLFEQGEKTILSPKQLKSLENQLKTEVKNFLPPDAKKLYEEYAVNKMISNIMKDNEVQRLVMRSLVGGGAAGGATLAAGLTSDKDAASIIKDTLIATLIGAAAGRATGSVGLKTVLGSAMKTTSPVAGQLTKTGLMQDIKSALKNNFSEEE